MENDISDSHFISKLPKIELHAHINGSMSEKTISKLVTMKKQTFPDWDPDGKLEISMARGTARTMQDCFRMFAAIHQLCQCDEAAYMVTKDVIAEFAEDNVKYLELRTTPRAVPETGMTKESYVNNVIKAIQEQKNNKDLDIIVKLLLAIDRRTTIEDAFDTLRLAEEVRSKTGDIIVGLDLSGDPNKGDATMFIPVFREAKSKGFKIALHVAEVKGQNEETEALLKLPPDRVGHGTFLHPDVGGSQTLVDLIVTQQIPIELCLTSNIKTSTVSSADTHHFSFWYNSQHLCTIGTDDKGVFCTSLSEEYQLAAKSFNLDRPQLWDISYSSIDYIFADEKTKELLKEKWNSVKCSLFKHKS